MYESLAMLRPDLADRCRSLLRQWRCLHPDVLPKDLPFVEMGDSRTALSSPFSGVIVACGALLLSGRPYPPQSCVEDELLALAVVPAEGSLSGRCRFGYCLRSSG
jgi:hypothetical protein